MELTERQKQLKANILNPEVRDGVPVSTELKKIWKVELENLEQFIGICERHKLRWFAVGGTLIGAARHKGFVPWDDDIDVAMPRSDYDEFLKIAQRELHYPYALSCSALEPGHWHQNIARICNVKTAALPRGYLKEGRRYNFGIFIDIIPVDGVTKSKILFLLQRKMLGLARSISSYHFIRFEHKGWSWVPRFVAANVLYCMLRNRGLEFLKNKIIKLVRLGSTDTCGYVAINFLERDVFPFRLLSDFVKLPFEYLELNCPKEFDEFLTVRYGDWRTFRPQEVYHHFDFYTDRSYRDLVIQEYGYDPEA